MWWLVSLASRFVLAATTFLKSHVSTLCFGPTSAQTSPFLLAVLVALMFNSLFFTLLLAFSDPNTIPSADKVLLGMFTRLPAAIDFRLMMRLVSLSWKLRGSLRTICQACLTASRLVLALRPVLWNVYHTVRAIYPVCLALVRALFAYLRVLRAAYRAASAAYLLTRALSLRHPDWAAFCTLFCTLRALSADLIHSAVLSIHLASVGTTLAKQATGVFCSWTALLFAFTASYVWSAMCGGAANAYDGVHTIVLNELVSFRSHLFMQLRPLRLASAFAVRPALEGVPMQATVTAK